MYVRGLGMYMCAHVCVVSRCVCTYVFVYVLCPHVSKYIYGVVCVVVCIWCVWGVSKYGGGWIVL